MQVASAAGAGPIGRGETGVGPGVVHGRLQALDVASEVHGTLAEFLRGLAHTLTQQPAEAAFALAELLCGLDHGRRVAPDHLDAVGVFLGEQTLLIALEGPRHGGARGDGVEAVPVAEVASVGHRFEVVDHGHGAERTEGLILGPWAFERVRPFLDVHRSATGDGTAVAADRLGQDRLRHLGAADREAAVLPLADLPVLDGDVARVPCAIEHHSCAVGRESRPPLVDRPLAVAAHLARLGGELVSIGQGEVHGAPHRDGLQLFGAEHRAVAPAAGSASVVVDEASHVRHGFACRADTGYASSALTHFLLNQLLGLEAVPAPQVLRVANLNVAVADPKVHRLG